jgi:hypothetical protein
VRVFVNCRLCKLAIVLQLLVVFCFNRPINPITKENPMSSDLRHNIHVFLKVKGKGIPVRGREDL